jgi:uncharacterized damage-inducible protein DinB
MRPTGSNRAAALAARLEQAAAQLIGVIETIDDDRWRHVPQPGVWSISKDVEHVAEAAGYHQWIVRLTIGDDVPKRKPVLERTQMTSNRLPSEAADMIRQRTDDGTRLLSGLTDDQLDLETRPPRANRQLLAETIERVLISHYDGHRADIEAKLRALADWRPTGED